MFLMQQNFNNINFCVGPVQENDYVRNIGSHNTPYFRTPEFSKIMNNNEELILNFANAQNNSKAVFLTGSGTASMEASIINTLSKNDKVLVVNGGSFGQRFCEILNLHNIPFDEVQPKFGESITYNDLNKHNASDYTCFMVNVHETSTGVKHDMDIISDFCEKNNLFLIVDAISSFLADELDLTKYNIDIMIAGSQKALAVPPGISMLVLSPRAIDRVNNHKTISYYLDLKSALKNQERGQTPFTPAVSILLQINERLNEIKRNGGIQTEINKTKQLATYFRNNINKYPFEITSKSLSNAVTPLHPFTINASKLVQIVKDDYHIWLCPNGGEMSEKIFRVGHIGNLNITDYNKLFEVFDDLIERKIL